MLAIEYLFHDDPQAPHHRITIRLRKGHPGGVSRWYVLMPWWTDPQVVTPDCKLRLDNDFLSHADRDKDHIGWDTLEEAEALAKKFLETARSFTGTKGGREG